MRERTTWSHNRLAEDPRAMNQDHFSQQPPADEYLMGTGTPGEFAEDIHPPDENWMAEEDGSGDTARNEIGLPEFRDDTFDNPEKVPGMSTQREASEAVLNKKANVCIKTARLMLRSASERDIENQAYALMHLPDKHLVATLIRLSAQDEEEEETQEETQGQGDQGQGGQSQQKKAQQEETQEETQGQGGQGQGGQSQQKKAQQEETREETQGQAKEASQQQIAAISAQIQQAACRGNTAQVQQLSRQLQQLSQQMQQAPQQQLSQQMQQQLGQQAPQQQLGQQAPQQALSEEEMLANLLGDSGQQMGQDQILESDIEMGSSDMFLDDVPEDPQLQAIFSSDAESQMALQAQALQNGMPAGFAPLSSMSRTASQAAPARTVGTRPSSGVSKLGGVSGQGSSELDQLSSLWNSDPDVSAHFR